MSNEFLCHPAAHAGILPSTELRTVFQAIIRVLFFFGALLAFLCSFLCALVNVEGVNVAVIRFSDIGFTEEKISHKYVSEYGGVSILAL